MTDEQFKAENQPASSESLLWKPSRRDFILAAGATTLGLLWPAGYASAQADTPEITKAKIGFVGQTDAAPIIIAKEKGYFAKYGMKDVEVAKQPSWGVIRDNLELGSTGGGLDVAMVLRPMPFLMALGTITKGNKKLPMYVPLQLNIDGQGITLANAFKDDKARLKSTVIEAKVDKAKADGKKYKFASTFKGGTSDLMMRYWLAAGGIDPDKDIETVVVPGPQLVANMKVGSLDGFCVGDPWHNRAISEKIGYTACVSGELWKDHPEKALAMRADWTDKNPKAARAIVAAIQEAQQWCDNMDNRDELIGILSKRGYANVPADNMSRLKGVVDYGDGRVVKDSPYLMRYWKANASYPFESHDLWFMTENARWGFIKPDFKAIRKVVADVNRADLWQSAAKLAGVPAASIPTKTSRGIETFFDGTKFDPAKPEAYLKSLKIKSVKAEIV